MTEIRPSDAAFSASALLQALVHPTRGTVTCQSAEQQRVIMDINNNGRYHDAATLRAASEMGLPVRPFLDQFLFHLGNLAEQALRHFQVMGAEDRPDVQREALMQADNTTLFVPRDEWLREILSHPDIAWAALTPHQMCLRCARISFSDRATLEKQGAPQPMLEWSDDVTRKVRTRLCLTMSPGERRCARELRLARVCCDMKDIPNNMMEVKKTPDAFITVMNHSQVSVAHLEHLLQLEFPMDQNSLHNALHRGVPAPLVEWLLQHECPVSQHAHRIAHSSKYDSAMVEHIQLRGQYS